MDPKASIEASFFITMTKLIVIIVLLSCSVAYGIYYFQLESPTKIQSNTWYMCCVIVMMLAIFSMGREVFLSAIHGLKEAFGLNKSE